MNYVIRSCRWSGRRAAGSTPLAAAKQAVDADERITHREADCR
jgi:hypothetical protein